MSAGDARLSAGVSVFARGVVPAPAREPARGADVVTGYAIGWTTSVSQRSGFGSASGSMR